MEYFNRLSLHGIEFQSHYQTMVDIWETYYKVHSDRNKLDDTVSTPSSQLLDELWGFIGS